MEIKNKRILVTGGTGFIGSHLIKELISQKAKVIVPYIEIGRKSYFSTENLSKKVLLHKVDITGKDKLHSLINKTKPEYIFHLAAITIVEEAYDNPWLTFETNVMGTANILEEVRKNKFIKGIIVASSDKAYGKLLKGKYKESDPLHGDHPYDVSKSCTDLIAQTYYKTYKTPVIITRFGNVYGEGDLHFNRIIPGICESIIKNKVFEIRSDGSYIRDYIYVKDVVNGYLRLLKDIDSLHGEAFNFSSKDSLSVLELIRQIESSLNITIPYKIMSSAKNEIPYQHLDDTKVRKLGWKTNSSIVKVMPIVLDWYRKIL